MFSIPRSPRTWPTPWWWWIWKVNLQLCLLHYYILNISNLIGLSFEPFERNILFFSYGPPGRGRGGPSGGRGGPMRGGPPYGGRNMGGGQGIYNY